eukprot:13199106-Alexandrium_andersonii.AAC.1
MSASLVGSEMCIRDRATPDPTQDARPPPAGEVAPWGEAMAIATEGAACLLYTSDAADDISV